MVPRPVQVTLSPAFMVTLEGEKPKLKALTLLVAATAGPTKSNCIAPAKINASALLQVDRLIVVVSCLCMSFITALMFIWRHKFHRLWQPQCERCHQSM